MATKKAKAAEHVNPNLIPMIDIMFLLLLFFMLGADMGQRDLESVRLPKASEAVPDKNKAERLTINANHRLQQRCEAYDRKNICRDDTHWNLTFRGQDCTETKTLVQALAQAPDPQGRPLSERRVMIRADGAAPFGLAQRAILACAQNGIYKVEVGAAKPAH